MGAEQTDLKKFILDSQSNLFQDIKQYLDSRLSTQDHTMLLIANDLVELREEVEERFDVIAQLFAETTESIKTEHSDHEARLTSLESRVVQSQV